MTDYVVRTATRDDVDVIIDWAAAEGWNPGHYDADPFHIADAEGYLVGLVDGEPVACISVVRFGKDFSFLGFYICRPEFRGRGHGFAIWQAGIERLGDRTIGLDGVIEQQPNYIKSGFEFAHRNIRYGGVARTEIGPDDNVVEVASPDESGPINAIIEYDRQFFPSDRERFLRAWIVPPHRTLAYIDGGTLRGFGTIRACRNGHKIGPLFANDAAIADRLFRSLTAPYPGDEIFLDTPEPNAAAIALAEREGMKPVFETARMYRGKTPKLPLERIFGITTFELG